MGLTFGDSQLCWRCKGTGKTERGVCAVCGGGKVLGVGEAPATEEEIRQREIAAGQEKGRELRDAAVQAVAVKEPRWIDRAMEWITSRPVDSEFTADDLTLSIGDPAKTNAVGSAFSFASRRKLVERAGLQQSSKPTSHASVIQVWRRV